MDLVKLNLKKIQTKKSINFKNLCFKIVFVGLCCMLITYSSILQQGIKNGINICVNMLIPSLFPFMVLASFTVTSGIFEKPNPIFAKITEKLFYLPGYTYPAIILSFIGGYPVGAKAAEALYKKNKINEEQLNRMMCFCTNSGPAFTINMLGITLLRNKTIGIIIFSAQVIIGILVGVICSFKARHGKKVFYHSESMASSQKVGICEALIDAVSSACESMLQMCAIIILFSAIIYFFNSFKIFELIPINYLNPATVKPILKFLSISCLEITCGCIYAANNNIFYFLIAFAIGYGGFCTHLQIAAILKKTKFKYLNFFIFRIINAAFSALAVYLALPLFKSALPAFSTIGSSETVIKSSSNPIGSVALVILCIYFMADIKLQKNTK